MRRSLTASLYDWQLQMQHCASMRILTAQNETFEEKYSKKNVDKSSNLIDIFSYSNL